MPEKTQSLNRRGSEHHQKKIVKERRSSKKKTYQPKIVHDDLYTLCRNEDIVFIDGNNLDVSEKKM
mgnify:CR=1 FL=1|jgi:hypothetical protein